MQNMSILKAWRFREYLANFFYSEVSAPRAQSKICIYFYAHFLPEFSDRYKLN